MINVFVEDIWPEFLNQNLSESSCTLDSIYSTFVQQNCFENHSPILMCKNGRVISKFASLSTFSLLLDVIFGWHQKNKSCMA